jgi:hypothetical protein
VPTPSALYLRGKDDNKNMVTGHDIVRAAYQLLGAPYRHWQVGDPIPIWRKDGMGEPPPPWHLHNVGVMGADLINFALRHNDLPMDRGTETFANTLYNTYPFDPSSPGQLGAIALRPYQGPQDDGSIALYVGEHQLIQSIPSEGVTDRYTDIETYSWASQGYPRYGFTIYGFLKGVDY